MKIKLKWIKEIIMEYSQKEAELILEGRDTKDQELGRVLAVLTWAKQAFHYMAKPPENKEPKEYRKNKEIREKQFADFRIAMENLKELGAFEKYMKS